MRRFPLAVLTSTLLAASACEDRSYPLGGIPGGAPDGAPSRPGDGVADAGAVAGGSGTTGGTSGDTGGAGGTMGGTGGTMGATGGTMGGTGGMGSPPPISSEECEIPAAALPIRPLGVSASQIAERLARFLWNDKPDAVLLAQAAKLTSSTDVQALARTMMADGRFSRGIEAFAHEWLGLGPILTTRAESAIADQVNPALRESMIRETVLFLQEQFSSGTGTLSTLLRAEHSFIDASLARIYEVPAPAGEGHWRTLLDPTKRAGLLTQPAALFLHGRAAGRGTWLQQTFMCLEIPLPPPDTNIDPIPAPAGLTYREALTASVASPSCAPCHALIDPPGFGLEHYDPIGRWRTTDNGKPIDASGVMVTQRGARFGFDGARRLAEGLTNSCDVHRCMAQKALQRAVGSERPIHEQSRGEIARAFVASGMNLRELLVATVGSAAFLAP